MRLFRYSCFIVMLSLCAVSCSDKPKKEKPSSLQPKMTLQAKDTTDVFNLTTEFLELLKAEKTDEAVSMLCFLDKEGHVIPLPDSLAERQKSVFRMFPVLSYKINSIVFNTETDSQVKYTVEFFKKQPGDTRPNTTSFFVKPMRVDGKWYLTMFDSNTYNGGKTEIKN